MKKSFSDAFIGLLRTAIDEVCGGSQREAARVCGVDPSAVNRWLNGKTSPRVEDVAPLFDAAGITLCKAGAEAGYNVTFAAPELINGEGGVEEQKWVAVPIVKDPGRLSAGFIPRENRAEWAIVHREFRSVKDRQDMLVVLAEDDSMAPTISQGAAVLIDRDFEELEDGRMYLVRTEGFAGVRRVFVMPDGDDRLLIMSAENSKYPPIVRLVKKHLGGDVRRCVLGRATWVRDEILRR